MFNSKFLKGSSYLVGSSLILSSAQGFGAAADLEDVNNEVKGTVNEGAAPAASLGVDCTSEELNDSEKVVSEKSNEDVAVAENVAVPERSEVELLKELLKTADAENIKLEGNIAKLKEDIKVFRKDIGRIEAESYELQNENLELEEKLYRAEAKLHRAEAEIDACRGKETYRIINTTLNFVLSLFLLDLAQAIIRGQKEIRLKKFWCSLDKVIGKYSFFSNIIDGVSLGIMKAWKGASVDAQAGMYRRIFNDGDQNDN